MSEFDRLIDLQKQINSVRTQLNQLMTLESPQSSGSNGWLKITDGLWSYASATTITVPAGAASIYAVGDQVRLKQGGAYKYFYIVTVADTLLTVTGGSDYSVANAAITDAAFSKGGGVGHPGWFNYTPTVIYDGGTTDPTSITTDFNFAINGKIVFVTGGGYLTRGAGDRTIIRVPLPISNVGGQYGVSASEDVTTSTITARGSRLGTALINVYLGTAMARDGGLHILAVYDRG